MAEHPSSRPPSRCRAASNETKDSQTIGGDSSLKRPFGTAAEALLGALILLALSAAAFFAQVVRAEESTDLTTADPELIERITEEVVRRLLEGETLDARIERGIERYVEKQRRAQAAAAAKAQASTSAAARNVRPVSPQRDHIYGDPNARVSLIEYSDFECPFCKRFHPTAKRLVDTSGGEVNWVYRHFPLPFHNPVAQREAEAAECAAALGGNEAFWRYAELLYERTRSNGNGLPDQSLAPMGVEIGLDEGELAECLQAGRFAARVQEDYEDGARIGITGTPGNVIRDNETGDVAVAPGAISYEALREVVDGLKSAP